MYKEIRHQLMLYMYCKQINKNAGRSSQQLWCFYNLHSNKTAIMSHQKRKCKNTPPKWMKCNAKSIFGKVLHL